jgi:hypothetical protein
MTLKFDVRDTFDMFWTEPLSILTKGLFSLVNIRSNACGEAGINVDFADNKTQITVVNNDKIFNLFKNVMNKHNNKLPQ